MRVSICVYGLTLFVFTHYLLVCVMGTIFCLSSVSTPSLCACMICEKAFVANGVLMGLGKETVFAERFDI